MWGSGHLAVSPLLCQAKSICLGCQAAFSLYDQNNGGHAGSKYLTVSFLCAVVAGSRHWFSWPSTVCAAFFASTTSQTRRSSSSPVSELSRIPSHKVKWTIPESERAVFSFYSIFSCSAIFGSVCSLQTWLFGIVAESPFHILPGWSVVSRDTKTQRQIQGHLVLPF